MKSLLCAALLAASCHAMADCKNALPLEGTVSIENCDPHNPNCIPGEKAVYDYVDKIKDDPAVITIGVNASPWRFYAPDMHILGVEELAAAIRPVIVKKGGAKRIVLLASWSGVAPVQGGKSLAQRLSEALGGFPVDGMDGFLWIANDGAMRTSHQAVSLMQMHGRPYAIAPGAEVMVSLAAGWPAVMSETFVKNRDADGVMHAGAGWDIFFLCPDRALQAFESAAKLSNPVGAYNAALMRLERNAPGDIAAATALLSQAAAAGDEKAKARLQQLRPQGKAPQGAAPG